MTAHGLFDGEDRAAHTTACDLAEMAAYIFPQATGADLYLGFDLIGWLYFYDDLFSGDLSHSPSDAEAVTAQFTAVLHGSPHLERAHPGVTAFADLWARQKDGMSSAWRTRAAYHWDKYLCSPAQEALNMHLGGVVDRDTYLEARSGASGSELVIDLTERLAHSEVPPAAFHCLPMRHVRRTAIEIVNFCNDIHSANRESALGDPHNLVLVVQREEHCARDKAVESVRRTILQHVEDFRRLGYEARSACELMQLSGEQGQAVDRYIQAMGFIMRGYDEWGRASARYTDAAFTPPWQTDDSDLSEFGKTAASSSLCQP